MPLAQTRTQQALEADASATYVAAVDERLVAATASRPAALSELLRAVPGAYPATVADRARALGLRVAAEPQADNDMPAPSPELHPLDYEWYFTARCAAGVASMLIADADANGGPILCLGAPTVAAAVAACGHAVMLVDRNPLVQARLNLAGVELRDHDLRQPIAATHTFGSVFFDAPWYPEEEELWLWQATRAVRRGGTISFALLPALVRPSASSERSRILLQVRDIGRTALRDSALRYDTPLFEAEALAAAGLPPLPRWRSADLVTVRHVNPRPIPRPAASPAVDDWDTWRIGQQVVKLRRVTQGTPGELLAPIGGDGGWVYTSVSRRNPNRDRVDLWTSRNRVARVGDRAAVATALDTLASYDPARAPRAVEESHMPRAVLRFLEI